MGDAIKIESKNDFDYRYPSRNTGSSILASNLVTGTKVPSNAFVEGINRRIPGGDECYTKREKLPDARHPNDSVSESISSYELVGCGPISHPNISSRNAALLRARPLSVSPSPISIYVRPCVRARRGTPMEMA